MKVPSEILHRMTGGRSRRDGPMMRSIASGHRSRITVAVAVGVFFGCVFAILYPHGLFVSRIHSSTSMTKNISSCEFSERIKKLKLEFVAASEENVKLKNQIRKLTEKLQLAKQEADNAQKHILVLGKQQKAGSFGTIKSLRANPVISPDKSVNPKLAKILEKIAVKKELIVALANSKVKDVLRVWFSSIKRVGVSNYLVVALDEDIVNFCRQNNVPVYERESNEGFDPVGRTGGSHTVSGLKFKILRQFLQLGYSVLLSDVDIVYLQNPFDHLHRDSDVESMTDGHDNQTAYGYNHIFDEPSMGWSRYVHTMRMWVYNSGFFYIKPTIPSIEFLDRVTGRLSREKAWDQEVFNEELFFPSHPGYNGLYASRRTLDFYLFMNSKVLFKTVRKDAILRKLKPVVVHLNYHTDKLDRMKAVVDYYVNGKHDALEPFPLGSD